jgi:hypothetical protein
MSYKGINEFKVYFVARSLKGMRRDMFRNLELITENGFYILGMRRHGNMPGWRKLKSRAM